MKRFIAAVAAIALLALLLQTLYYSTDFVNPLIRHDGVQVWASTANKEIVIADEEGEWEPFTLRGVNMGSGKPGAYATDYAITYEEYMNWFRQIQEMNANVLRVYTILGPEFYHAFYDFNMESGEPLYLIHGVWVDDYVLRNRNDAYAKDLRDHFKEDCSKVVDVLHGHRRIFFNSRHGYGNYEWDVSPWVLGYILGVEWQADQVMYTDHKRDDVAGFDGTYLYTTVDATPFESLMCEVGDHIIGYETRKYGQQRLVAFSNWTETDPLEHEVWLSEQVQNRAHFDTEHIQAHDSYESGLFASYHVYPYYPEFLNFESAYTTYIDETGEINPYRAYLKALNEHHDMPVVIAEFGIPTSRGISHEDAFRGYDQGNKNEQEQGEGLVVLYDDIIKAGCSGGIIFSWQDEWFKRTWNVMYAIDTAREPYWADIQTNEEFFGLLAYDTGKTETISQVDGDVSEWSGVTPVAEGEGLSLSMMYDEAYVYFRVHLDGQDAESTKAYIALDITPKSGSAYDETHDLTFDREMDFVIQLDGRENSKVMVQERYCALWANYRREIYLYDAFFNPPARDSSLFMDIDLYLRDRLSILSELYVPEHEKGNIDLDVIDDGNIDRVTLAAQLFPTGELRHGNSNPDAPDFDSIADFMFAGSDVEVRIPWQLLNFSDASEMMIHDDYYEHYGVEDMQISELYASVMTDAGGATASGKLELKGWGRHPTAHERLKRSYYIVQAAFGQYKEAGE